MTLVHDGGAGPGVHALVIGVGAYRHLPGGAEPVTHDTLGLRQVSGPPFSARAVADFLTTSLHHPAGPVRSVELLVSEATPTDFQGHAVEAAESRAVAEAFDRWLARCDAFEENVALLFFCGHGVERESQLLLLEDFGASANRLLEGAVDIGATFAAMTRCRARQQYLFIDACREVPNRLLQQLTGSARVLLDQLVTPDRRTGSALFLATAGGARAYGKAKEPTRFTKALLSGLAGLGAQRSSRHWEVDVPGLQRALASALVGVPREPDQVPQVRAGGTGVLNRLTSPPLVPVRIGCRPPTALGSTVGSLTAAPAPDGTVAVAPAVVTDGDSWRCEVPADQYSFTVTRDGAVVASQPIWAYPPGATTEMVDVP